MITAVHTLVYADDAEAARAFFRDVLGWPHVDAHDGWLIFRTGPSEMAAHPTGGGSPQHHEITLMCDDLEATMAELRGKGATFKGEIRTESFGRLTYVEVPGAGDLMVYQPRHLTAYDLPG